jgi:ADP-heptose:LPS heptosyltransferase
LTDPSAFLPVDEKGMKILAIHSGGIGDLLLALPALRAFRNTFPHASLELMGFPERLSLIAHDLEVQSIHSIDQSGMAYFYTEGGSLPFPLVDFFSSFSSAILFGQARAQILAQNLKRAGIKDVIFLPSFPPEGSKEHVSDYLVQTLRALGIEGPKSFLPLKLPGEVFSLANECLEKAGWKKGNKILSLHPGSGSSAKNWSPKNFSLVAEWVNALAQVLLIAGPAEDGGNNLKRELKKGSPIIAANLPLLHLAGILKCCSAYLGNDSGITHLAALLGIPTLAIFGPTDPSVWGPRGPHVQIFGGGESCTLCSAKERAECNGHCLERIKPESVLKKLAPFMK